MSPDIKTHIHALKTATRAWNISNYRDEGAARRVLNVVERLLTLHNPSQALIGVRAVINNIGIEKKALYERAEKLLEQAETATKNPTSDALASRNAFNTLACKNFYIELGIIKAAMTRHDVKTVAHYTKALTNNHKNPVNTTGRKGLKTRDLDIELLPAIINTIEWLSEHDLNTALNLCDEGDGLLSAVSIRENDQYQSDISCAGEDAIMLYTRLLRKLQEANPVQAIQLTGGLKEKIKSDPYIKTRVNRTLKAALEYTPQQAGPHSKIPPLPQQRLYNDIQSSIQKFSTPEQRAEWQEKSMTDCEKHVENMLRKIEHIRHTFPDLALQVSQIIKEIMPCDSLFWDQADKLETELHEACAMTPTYFVWHSKNSPHPAPSSSPPPPAPF